LQIAPDEKENPLVLHPPRHTRHQHVMVDAVEELRQVQVHHPSMVRRDMLAGA